MTYNDRILSYLSDYPTTVRIVVQLGNLAAAQPVPDGITVEEAEQYYVEYFDIDANSLARLVWTDG